MSKSKRASRKEGYKIKTLPPLNSVAPYIMKTRGDATNYISGSICIEGIEDYIFKKRNEGLNGFGLMHVVLAAYVRMLATHPELNRFIRGQRIYSRNCIEAMITIKRDMTVEAEETVLKLIFPPDATAEDVYNIVNSEIDQYRSGVSDFDNTAKLLNYIPGLFLKFTVWVLNLLDYFGLLPRKLTKLSPFHGSFAFTSMASLGIPPIYHHLYNFGNIPLFMSLGKKYTKLELQRDGSVIERRYADYKITCDERICDGFTYASALKCLNTIVRNIEMLDSPPEEIKKDIE